MTTVQDPQTESPAVPRIPGATSSGRLRVVYLAGSGHTGSTLLAILLQTHPRIISVGETSIKPKIRRRGDGATQKCSCGTLIDRCAFWQSVFSRVNEQGFPFSAECWSNDYRLEHPVIHKLLSSRSSHQGLRWFQDWAADHLPIYRARVQRIDRVNVAFIRAVLQAGNADVFFDTSKRLMRLSRLLRMEELDVKVIQLVRDVRGYAASAKRRGYEIADASRSWRETQNVISSITAALPDDRKLLLRYEDLCTDVEATMHRLYRFIGVDIIPAAAAVDSGEHHVIGNSMRFQGTIRVKLDETWRERLTQQEQSRILKIAGRSNREFGYV